MSHGKQSVLAVAQQKVEVAGLGFSLAQSEGRESLLAMPSQIKVTTEGVNLWPASVCGIRWGSRLSVS